MMGWECASPVPLSTLVDYFAADLSVPEEQEVEEHLFSCEDCSRRLQNIAALSDAICAVAWKGPLFALVTDSIVERLTRDGFRMRVYQATAGDRVPCTIEPQDDLVLTRLLADFSGAQRVDLVVCDAGGREQRRIEDIAVNRDRGEVSFSVRADLAREMPPTAFRFRLISVEKGGERSLGEYTFLHTPFSPL